MTPQEFITKWRNVELKERTASQSHFLDLCRLLQVLDPVSADPKGEWFTFEKGASKTTGGEGWADVWRKDCFAWEYKGKNKDLDRAFAQLQQYASHLQQAGHHPGRLPERQLEQNLYRQAELDRRVRKHRRPTGAAVMRRKPGHVLVQPDQEGSAFAQRRRVTGPVRRAVAGG